MKCHLCRETVTSIDPQVVVDTQCSICLCTVTRMRPLRPCGHMFCTACCDRTVATAQSEEEEEEVVVDYGPPPPLSTERAQFITYSLIDCHDALDAHADAIRNAMSDIQTTMMLHGHTSVYESRFNEYLKLIMRSTSR